MKKSVLFSMAALAFTLCSCQQRMFGLDEATWATLSEQEREKVIVGYNSRKEMELVNEQKTREKQLENERRSKEIEAETAPFYAAADAISSICEVSKKQPKSSSSKREFNESNRIQAVSSKIGKQVVTIAETQFEVSPFTKFSDAWLKGQKVEISKNDHDMFYSVRIKNLDNGEVVSARKSKI